MAKHTPNRMVISFLQNPCCILCCMAFFTKKESAIALPLLLVIFYIIADFLGLLLQRLDKLPQKTRHRDTGITYILKDA